MANAHASEHDADVAALAYQCVGEEVDVFISLDDAAAARVRLEADLFPHCLNVTDVSHCQDESCRESALDACLADSVLEWDFGDGSSRAGGAAITHSYAGAGVFALDVRIRAGQLMLYGADCELTLRPTQVSWTLDLPPPDLQRQLGVGDRFEVAVAVTTTVGVGMVQDFGFDLPGVLSIDSDLFLIASSPLPVVVNRPIGPAERIWSGRFLLQVLAEGAGHIGLPMHYRADGETRFDRARERIIVGVDPVSRVLPVVHYLLGLP